MPRYDTPGSDRELMQTVTQRKMGGMEPWQTARSIVSSRILARLGVARGLPLEACLVGSGITAAQLDDPEAEVSGLQELRLIQNLQQGLGHLPAVAMEAGLEYPVTVYGIFGFALISSPTLRAALETGVRYIDLTFALTRIRLESGSGSPQLVIDPRDTPSAVAAFAVERDLVAVLMLLRQLVGAPTPAVAIDVALPPVAHAVRYQSEFGIVPRFGATRTAVVLDTKRLDARMPQADHLAASLCEQQCRALLARRRSRAGYGETVRHHLLEHPAQPPALTTIAARLAMSPRSLRRRLDEEGTSYRALLDEVRQVLSEALLVTAGLSVDAVAERLGFAETASFIHAFKRWHGVTPGVYRRRAATSTPKAPP